MKYLLITKSRIGTVVPKPTDRKATLNAAMKWNAAKQEDGSFDYVYGFADGRGGVSVVNAESHEDLLMLIRSSPMYHYIDYEIRPLCDLSMLFKSQIDAVTRHEET